MGGEIRNPEKTVARAAWIAGLSIAAFYIAGTLAMLVLLPPDQVSVVTGLVQAAAAAGARLGVGWPPLVLAFAIGLGVTGQLGAWIAGSARLPFVIGIDHYLPPIFSRLHPRWQTPHLSILILSGACTVFVIAMQAGENLRIGYQLLVDMTVVTYFVPFLYLFGAAWKNGQRASSMAGLAVTTLGIVLSFVPPPCRRCGCLRVSWQADLGLSPPWDVSVSRDSGPPRGPRERRQTLLLNRNLRGVRGLAAHG